MGNMLIQRTAAWLLAWGAMVVLAAGAVAQVPSNSNLNYRNPTPSWENASADFAESAPAAHVPPLIPGPLGVEPELDPFAPAETSSYGNGPRAKIGLWASYERVFWSLSKPTGAPIGSRTAQGNAQVVQENAPGDNVTTPPRFLVPQIPNTFPDGPSMDNSFIAATGAWGNRWEFGYVGEENYGWQVSILDHVSQGQYRVVQNPSIRFDDPANLLHALPIFTFPGFNTNLDVGEMPTAFNTVTMKNVLQMNGVELMRSYRAPRLHNGGYFTLLYGARWLQINDTFSLQTFSGQNGSTLLAPFDNFSFAAADLATLSTGTSIFTVPQNILADSQWSVRALNSLVGPQIGGRWEVQRGRWITSFEARAMVAANFENVRLTSNLGNQRINNQPITDINMLNGFRGLGSDIHQFSTVISPVGEIRANVSYQVTSNFALKVGYTGIYVGDISRASNRIDYSGPNLVSLLTGSTHQIFFANGVNFGVEFNR